MPFPSYVYFNLFPYIFLSPRLSFYFPNSFSCFLMEHTHLFSQSFVYGIVFIIYKLRGHRFELMWMISAKPNPSHTCSCLTYLCIIFFYSFYLCWLFPHLNWFFYQSFNLSYNLSFFWTPGTRNRLNSSPLYNPLLVSPCKSFSSFFPSCSHASIQSFYLNHCLFF